jgi:hypothetical protein
MNRHTLLTTLLCCCALLQCCGKASPVRDIERVLKEDKTTTDGVKSVAEVVSRMRALNLNGCPRDFIAAYTAHIHAWELAADAERDRTAWKKDYYSGGAVLESIVRGFALDPFGKTNEMMAEDNRIKEKNDKAHTKITETIQHVEDVAVGYGAELPRKK